LIIICRALEKLLKASSHGVHKERTGSIIVFAARERERVEQAGLSNLSLRCCGERRKVPGWTQI
jgi:hypothetical protein